MNPQDDDDEFGRRMDAIEMIPVVSDPDRPGPPGLHVTHEGVFRSGRIAIRVYRLSDGSRVFDESDIQTFFRPLAEEEGE